MNILPTDYDKNPNYATYPDGTPKPSGIALYKAQKVPCTTGGFINVTEEIYYVPANLATDGLDHVIYCLMEQTPFGWEAFNRDPVGCQIWNTYATLAPLGAAPLFTIPGGGGAIGTFDVVVAALGKQMIDGYDNLENATIAARFPNGGGLITPPPNPLGEPQSYADAQGKLAWDIYYQGFGQPDPNKPLKAWATAQEP